VIKIEGLNILLAEAGGNERPVIGDTDLHARGEVGRVWPKAVAAPWPLGDVGHPLVENWHVFRMQRRDRENGGRGEHILVDNQAYVIIAHSRSLPGRHVERSPSRYGAGVAGEIVCKCYARTTLRQAQ